MAERCPAASRRSPRRLRDLHPGDATQQTLRKSGTGAAYQDSAATLLEIRRQSRAPMRAAMEFVRYARSLEVASKRKRKTPSPLVGVGWGRGAYSQELRLNALLPPPPPTREGRARPHSRRDRPCHPPRLRLPPSSHPQRSRNDAAVIADLPRDVVREIIVADSGKPRRHARHCDRRRRPRRLPHRTWLRPGCAAALRQADPACNIILFSTATAPTGQTSPPCDCTDPVRHA